MKKVRSSQASTQFFPVNIVNNEKNLYFEEKFAENKNSH